MSTTFSNERTHDTTLPRRREAGGRSALLAPFRAAARFWQLWKEALEKCRDVRGLTALDDRTLGDIGVTRSELGWRAAQPFWKQPESLDEAPKPSPGPVIPIAPTRRRSGVPRRR
ncbi:MAG TPA: DUF1127 domain-containing protein [Stellaceae bacterium]|nr:DUF1127 domain-containing protein [Stellaceae bacterium]